MNTKRVSPPGGKMDSAIAAAPTVVRVYNKRIRPKSRPNSIFPRNVRRRFREIQPYLVTIAMAIVLGAAVAMIVVGAADTDWWKSLDSALDNAGLTDSAMRR